MRRPRTASMDGCQLGERSDDNVLLHEWNSEQVMSYDTDSQHGDTCQPKHDATSISSIAREDDGNNMDDGDESKSTLIETWPDEVFSIDEQERVKYSLCILLLRNSTLVNIVQNYVILNVYRILACMIWAYV